MCVFWWLGGCEREFKANNHGSNPIYIYFILFLLFSSLKLPKHMCLLAHLFLTYNSLHARLAGLACTERTELACVQRLACTQRVGRGHEFGLH
jgi:hypothetical protein